ncbi:MAG TPA: carboxypeptidase-like regulatory domain-containing protein [Acidobacteriaceae bacterium]
MFDNTSRHLSGASSAKLLATLIAAVLVVAGLFGGVAQAQLAGTGAIAGTVQDPSGAVVAKATVTATNTGTNVQTTRTTTGSGDYNITPLLPGNYTVTVAASGFEGFKQENVTVDALSTVSLNMKLTVGRASETVTISTAPPILETSDATLGGVMDNEMYSNLPLQMGGGAAGKQDQRRATDFEYLMPGVQGNFTSNDNTSNSGIVNGSGPSGGVSEIYIDGVNLPEADQVGDPRFTWTAIGVDAVEQFQVQTAGVSAQYGGQGVQNYSIKSGGNSYHGSLYEYNRNTVFDAWKFTSKVPTLNAKGQTIPGGIKPREVMNEFGIVLSGPILKNKLFLFGNYGQYRFQQGATYSSMTIPTAAELGYTQSGQALGYADFTGYAAATGAHIYDPSTQTPGCSTCSRTQFAAMKNGVLTQDVIPAGRVSAAANYYNQFLLPYQSITNQSAFNNNLAFGTPIGLANWYSTGSIDYNQSAKNQVRLLIAFGRQAATGLNSGSGLKPPFNASQIYNPVTTVDVLKDTWTISAHIVNQFAIGYGRYQSNSVTPNRQKQFAAQTAGITNMPAGQASDGFPGISWSGTFDNPSTWGGYAWNNKINNTYSLSDNLQWDFGKHSITIGGQVVDAQFNYYKVVSPSGPMGITFSSAQTANFTSGSATNSNAGYSFASYTIGAASSGSTSANVPGLGTRWLDPSFWVEDDFKVSPRLTLNMGLRWDIYPSIKEAHNIFSFLNPNGVNSVTGNKGTLQFAGNGDPALYCNCKSPSPISLKNFGPRLGMAFSLNPKTVLRGSYNVNVARGDWTSGSQSGSPSTLGFTPGASAPAGVSGAPAFYWDNTACTAGAADGVACGWTGSVVAPAPPIAGQSLNTYGTGETNAAGLGTQTALGMTYFDPYKGGRTPQYENWSFGVQRQVTKDMSITVSYVGSQGHFVSGGLANPARTNRLTSKFAALAGYNINTAGTTVTACTQDASTATGCGFVSGATTLLGSKATTGAISAISGMGIAAPNPFVGQTYLSTNGATGYFTSFPQFSGVSDTTNFNGNTNYHALQITLRQRPAHGLDFMLNYTYSKSMDDLGTFRTNDNARLDRSLSVTDQPQNLTGTVVYRLPFGHGHIGGDNFLANAIGGGWSLSGIYTYHSGSPLVVTGSGCAGSPLGTCMPSIVPGVQPRINQYGKNITSDPSSATYYAKTPFLVQPSPTAPGAFTNTIPGNARGFGLYGGAATTGSPTVCTQTAVATCSEFQVGNGPNAYIPGNAPRVGALNVWSMSAYNVDLGIKRTFKIWESVNLQFEADLLNATNHVVWGSVNGGVGGSSFGLVTGLANQPRDAQLSGRINW